MNIADEFDLEVQKMKEVDSYIDMILENCDEQQIQHIILELDRYLYRKTWNAMTNTVEFVQKFIYWNKDIQKILDRLKDK